MDCLAAETVRLGLLIRFRGITCRLLKSSTSQINALDVGLWHYSAVFPFFIGLWKVYYKKVKFRQRNFEKFSSPLTTKVPV